MPFLVIFWIVKMHQLFYFWWFCNVNKCLKLELCWRVVPVSCCLRVVLTSRCLYIANLIPSSVEMSVILAPRLGNRVLAKSFKDLCWHRNILLSCSSHTVFSKATASLFPFSDLHGRCDTGQIHLSFCPIMLTFKFKYWQKLMMKSLLFLTRLSLCTSVSVFHNYLAFMEITRHAHHYIRQGGCITCIWAGNQKSTSISLHLDHF